jgi:hypothetical protein
MTTLDDLRRTLDNHARHAPDGLGVVAEARLGAARIRRRRRILSATAAAAVVAVVAASLPLVTAAHRAGPPQPPPAATPTYRQPWQTTLTLDPAAGYVVESHGTDATREMLQAGRTGGDGDHGGVVVAHDPGTFDPARLLAGERVTVSDHAAWLVRDYGFDRQMSGVAGRPLRTVVVGWQDPAGAWVLVHRGSPPGTDPRHLLTFAAAVRVGPARDVRSPLRFGWTPGGLSLSYFQTFDRDDDQVVMAAGFASAGRAPADAATYNGMPPGLELTVTAAPADARQLPDDRTWPGARFTVAGHSAWYSDGNGPSAVREGASELLVDAGSCLVRIESRDRRRISRDDLNRLVEHIRFGRCDAKTGWTRPIG